MRVLEMRSASSISPGFQGGTKGKNISKSTQSTALRFLPSSKTKSGRQVGVRSIHLSLHLWWIETSSAVFHVCNRGPISERYSYKNSYLFNAFDLTSSWQDSVYKQLKPRSRMGNQNRFRTAE